MDTCSLKEYIFENKKVEFVLEKIGNKNIKYHPNKNYFSCSNYDGDNPGAVNVTNNEHLMVINWTRPKEFDNVSDIITLTQYNERCSFVDAIKHLHNILGLEYSPYKKVKKDIKKDPLWKLKQALSIGRGRGTGMYVDVNDIHVIDEEAINDYVPLLYIDWYKEGIMPWAAKRFGIAYSYKHKRVVIPLRYWLDGSLLGFNQRTVVKNYDEFGISKYFLTPFYKKSINLYGLWENRKEIERVGQCVIFESEKSVLKRYSRTRWTHEGCGEEKKKYDETCVALQGKNLSDEQLRIINGLNVNEVIVALDNDVPLEEVRHMCEQFYNCKNGVKVSYIYDNEGLLGEKDSPADAENTVYMHLLNHRTLYDEKEHKKYVNSLKRQASDLGK